MKTAQDIYEEYRIMPSLQLHQLRVAAVAKLICENFKEPLDERTIVLACLFHDMGNIIKSDLNYFREFVEPEGLEYWQSVKDDFLKKYGADHHVANAAITGELGLPADVVALLDGVGFSHLKNVSGIDSHELKIVQYADLRVGPLGILSIEKRLIEGRERYIATRRRDHPYSDSDFEELMRTAEKLEKQIFVSVTISPDDITDTEVAPLIEELRTYPIA